MGPFGTIVIVPMFPELRDQYSTSLALVSFGFALYLIPFAICLLFSGTLGERWGRRRTVRATYLIYAIASVLCALAPTLGVFVAARALQGVANAFITPLLIAGLAETVPPERLSGQVGIYSSFQALGGGLGPVIGGLAADASWQWAFWGTAVVATSLALVPPPGKPRPDAAAPPWRPLLKPGPIMLSLAFGFAAAGPVGVAVLVGVAARDVLFLDGTTAGTIMFVGAMSALVLGPVWGRLTDQIGLIQMLPVSVLVATVAAALPGLANSALALGVTWAIAGAAVSLTVVVFQSLGATLLPENRGGGLSFLLSLRFVGHALGPLVFVPMVLDRPARTFTIAAMLGLVTLALALSAPTGHSAA